MAKTIDDLTADVAANKDKTDKLVATLGTVQTNLANVQKQLADLQAGGTLSAADQEKLDKALTILESNNTEIDTALAPKP